MHIKLFISFLLVAFCLGGEQLSPEADREATKRAREERLRNEKRWKEEEKAKKSSSSSTTTSGGWRTSSPADQPVEDPAEARVRERARQIEQQKTNEKVAKEKKKRLESESPAMKQAMKELEEEEKKRSSRIEKNRKYNQQLDQREVTAGVTGCQSGSVEIGKPAADKNKWRVMSVVTVINPSAVEITEIRAGHYGVVVQNLCPTGAMTLYFSLRWEDPDQLQIPLVAIFRRTSGEIGVSQYFISLNKWNQNVRRIDPHVWVVR